MGEEERDILAVNVDMSCDEDCESCERFFDCDKPARQKVYDRKRVKKILENMKKIKHKVGILAGKGGVGKSLLSANLTMALAMRGRNVNILDHDFDGPCIPKMFGVEDKRLYVTEEGIEPVIGEQGVGVVSTGLMMGSEEYLTWFHDLRRSATEEFLSHVIYGDSDYLIIDLPPGTSSDAVNMMTYIPDIDGVIVITIPPQVSQTVALRAGLLCQKAKVKILGVVENMSGYVCPDCKEIIEVFKTGGGEKLARDLGVPFLGRIPLDPSLSESSDIGRPFVYTHPESPASKSLFEICDKVEEMVGWGK